MGISGIGGLSTDYTRFQTQQAQQNEPPQVNENDEQQALSQTQQAPPPKPAQEGGQTENDGNGTANGQQQAASASVQNTASTAQAMIDETEDDDSSDDDALINKANSGSPLSSSELSRLKEADPALYSRVMKAQEARDELRTQMQDNPSAAEKSAQNAIIKNQDDAIARQALEEEYLGFSAKYDRVSFSIDNNFY